MARRRAETLMNVRLCTCSEMMAIIERDGKFDGTEYKRYLRQDIVCFRCQHRPRTFDDLKSHIATCLG